MFEILTGRPEEAAEKAGIERRSTEIVEAVEQNVVAEREAARAAAARQGGGEGSSPGESSDDDKVLEEKTARGMEFARIFMRVAGRCHNIPKKIMPDEDDSSKFVRTQRDPETREMVPVL